MPVRCPTTRSPRPAQDSGIHDTVLIAAAFCMYNRYVSCLSTDVPAEEGCYHETPHRIVGQGYGTGLHPDHAPDMSVSTSAPANGG